MICMEIVSSMISYPCCKRSRRAAARAAPTVEAVALLFEHAAKSLPCEREVAGTAGGIDASISQKTQSLHRYRGPPPFHKGGFWLAVFIAIG